MNLEKSILLVLLFVGAIWATSTISYKKGYQDANAEWQVNTVKMGYAHFNTFSGLWEWNPNVRELTLTNITTVVEEPTE